MTQGIGNEVIDSRFLQTCDIPLSESRVAAFTLMIFGGNGDLSRKKLMPSIFRLWQGGELPEHFSVLGFGRRPVTDEEFRKDMKDAVSEAMSINIQQSLWQEFGRHLYYLSGDITSDRTMKLLSDKLDGLTVRTDKGSRDVIFYMAVPPETTPVIVKRLADYNLCKGIFDTKIIVEKPFGMDSASSRALNAILKAAFAETQIYRIDHYLGKETVQNIMFFRFSNAILEQTWNARFIDNVQITVAEDIGIEHRGEFYESNGIVRDIVQNHVMQLIGMIAMEPPVGFTADYIRNEKIKVVQSLRPMDNDYIDRYLIRGQYGRGMVNGKQVVSYREEDKVSPSSVTPTFFVGRFYVDNLRWASVPFYVRCGKRLKRQVTEICLQFRMLPLRLFGRTCDVMEPNVLTMTVKPEEKISLRFSVKYPYSQNQIHTANMDFCYRGAFEKEHQGAYERLLVDCMKGDLTLFVREDMVEAMWEVVDPIIDRWNNIPPMDFPNYEAGSWGPDAVRSFFEREGQRWLTV
ncbi:MAG: glucose-6-phosphate dehydrogenase [Dissulfurispiraceae bacterium]